MSREDRSPESFDWARRPGQPTEGGTVPDVSDYPELEPVVTLALDAVISSFHPDRIDARLRSYLERVTVAATVGIYAPIAAIAARAEHRDQESRVILADEAARAAENLAASVAAAAAALQVRDEASALTVANDASVAAQLVAGSVTSHDDEAEMAAAAAAVAALVHDAAAEIVLERARAAMLVAQSAIGAASTVAATADGVTVTSELRGSQAAAALRAVALETCYQVAISVAASAAEAVLADGMPD